MALHLPKKSFINDQTFMNHNRILILIFTWFFVGVSNDSIAQYHNSHVTIDILDSGLYHLEAFILRKPPPGASTNKPEHFFVLNPSNGAYDTIWPTIIKTTTVDSLQDIKQTLAQAEVNLKSSRYSQFDTARVLHFFYRSINYIGVLDNSTNDATYYVSDWMESTRYTALPVILNQRNLQQHGIRSNNSPHLDTISHGYIRDVQFISPGISRVESDDSIVVNLSKTIPEVLWQQVDEYEPIAPFKFARWNNGFSYKYPIHLNCPRGKNNCDPYLSSYPYNGIYTDSLTGNSYITFRDYNTGDPTHFPFTLKISEFKKVNKNWIHIADYFKYFHFRLFPELNLGKSYRDHASRLILDKRTFNVFATDTFDKTLKTTKSTTEYSNQLHFNELMWDHGIDNCFMSVVDSLTNFKSLNVQWEPRVGQIRKNPYFITLYIRSDTGVSPGNVSSQTNSYTIPIYVHKKPHIHVSVDSVLCNRIHVSAQEINLPGTWSYFWELLDSSGVVLTRKGIRSVLLAPDSAKYSIRLRISNPDFESDLNADTSFLIQRGFSVDVPSDTSICANECISVHPEESNVSGSPSYQWDNGSVIQTTDTLHTCETGRYVLRSTNADGCTDFDTLTIRTLDTLALSIGKDSAYCPREEIFVRIPSRLSGLPFKWHDGNQSDTTRTFRAPTSASLTITDTITGCVSTAFRNAQARFPDSTINVSGSLCKDQTVRLIYLRNASDSISLVQWKIASQRTDKDSVDLVLADSTPIELSLTFRSYGKECSLSFISQIVPHPVPGITLIQNDTICSETLPLDLQIKEQYDSIQWTHGGKLEIPDQYPHGVRFIGPKRFSLTVTDSNNCNNSLSADMFIEHADSLFGELDSQLCWNLDQLDITTISSVYGAHVWSNTGSGNLEPASNPQYYSPDNSDRGRSVEFQVEGSSGGYCLSPVKNFKVNFPSDPGIVIIPYDTAVCAPFQEVFRLNPELSDERIWSINASQVSSQPRLNRIFEGGIYDIGCVWDKDGCRDTADSRRIEVFTPIQLDGFVIENTGNGFYKISAQADQESVKNEWWLNGERIDTASDLSILHLFDGREQILVQLRMTDTNGCLVVTDSLINFDPEPFYFIPNAFTPNGNALNETFKPVTLGYDWVLDVYSSTGQHLFHGENTGWDGSHKGQRCQSDVYYFHIRFTNGIGSVSEKGSVLLAL